MDSIKASAVESGDICFLLDINYYGSIYRFSTVPIDIEDLQENSLLPYRGLLEDPDINLQTERIGVDLEANTISLELIFEALDWVKEFLKGRTINDAECSLSMVVIRDGRSIYSKQEAIGIFKGRAMGAIFGDPQKHLGWVSFTIENTVNIRSVKLLGEKHLLDEDEYSIGIIPQSKGKVIPFVFGELGIIPVEKAGSIDFELKMLGAPAYQAGGTPTLKTQYFQIAYHEVQDGNIRIYDGVGGDFLNPIEVRTDSKGNLHAFVPYYLPVGSPEGTNIEDNSFQVSSPEISFGYWASWGESNGGISSLLGEGALKKAVDLSLYCLEISDLDYDYGAWVGLSAVLDRYKFGGYVNDLEVTAIDWIQNNIWSLLPIMVTNSGKGLKPSLDLYSYAQTIEPSHYLNCSGEVEIISPMTPLEGEIINKITIRFAYEAGVDNYRSKVVIDPTLEEDTGLSFRDPLAFISYTRYGLREKVIEAPFVWDLQTAIRIARDKIRMHALGNYAIEISTAPRYGYIELGDIISLTSEHIGLENHKCQVISKSWSENRWRFILHIEDNPLVNIRS